MWFASGVLSRGVLNPLLLLLLHYPKISFSTLESIFRELTTAAEAGGLCKFIAGARVGGETVAPVYVGTTQHSINTRLTEQKRHCRLLQLEKQAVAKHALQDENHVIQLYTLYTENYKN